jgi:hypothetical protein
MKHTGPITKMSTRLAQPVEYSLTLGNIDVAVNSLVGKSITLKWLNEIRCMNCGRVTKKSFAQGYCYPCFASIPETEECVLKPELCRAHEGVARDMVWAQEHCLQDHFVYLAVSSEMKVGVTRQSQVPTRWIDQGASKAIKLARTPNRFLAGCIELALKNYLTDKTNWRNMLTNKLANVDLLSEKKRIAALLPDDLKAYVTEEDEITEINYPSIAVPVKVNSIDIEKINPLSGVLTGIKGQYLILDNTNVINIRKYGGYVFELETE